MNKLLLILCGCVLLLSCKDNLDDKKESEIHYLYKAPLHDRDLINGLIIQAIDSGNEKAYNELANYHLIESQGEEFLYYALKFAHKYNSAEAYYHVYDILVRPRNGERLNDLDNQTKNVALYYLLKSYEMGYHSSQFDVAEVFGEGKTIPKSSFYLEEFLRQSENP